MFEIKRYTAGHQEEWNAFVAKSKNGTFLFDRRYMDYHSDRFADSSLMFYRESKLYAILPANRVGDTLCSHQGLTYGGLLMDEACTAEGVLHLFMDMNAWLKGEGVNRVVYKPIPYIYATLPAEEDLYALFRSGARLVARGISSTMDFNRLLKWRHDRHTALNRSRRNGLMVRQVDDMSEFWTILTDNLVNRHGVRPVHTLEEMKLLKERFADNITLYEAIGEDGEVLAGMLLYRCGRVLHSQYLAASPEGKKVGAIEAIIDVVLDVEKADYFDFGISTEEDGHVLNEGLISQKEGFGGRGVCYDRYEYSLQ